MKRFIPILFLVSCTVQHGSKERTYPTGVVEKSSHLYASLGSKAKGLANSPEESSILELDDTISAKYATTLAGSMYSAWALLGAQESNNALEAGKVAQAARTDRTEIVSKAAVEKASINADVAKEALKLQP